MKVICSKSQVFNYNTSKHNDFLQLMVCESKARKCSLQTIFPVTIPNFWSFGLFPDWFEFPSFSHSSRFSWFDGHPGVQKILSNSYLFREKLYLTKVDPFCPWVSKIQFKHMYVLETAHQKAGLKLYDFSFVNYHSLLVCERFQEEKRSIRFVYGKIRESVS